MTADEKSVETHLKMKKILRIRVIRERKAERAHEEASQKYAEQQVHLEEKQAEIENFINERNRLAFAQREMMQQRSTGADFERMLVFEENTKKILVDMVQEIEDGGKELDRLAEDVRNTYNEWQPAASRRNKTEKIVDKKREEAEEYLMICEEEAASDLPFRAKNNGDE